MSCFYSLKGVYSPKDQFLGIDYAKSFLNPIEARMTMVHEATHRVIADTEYGQCFQTLLNALPDMSHFNAKEVSEITQKMYQSQIFVQEGTATLMQILHLKAIVGKSAALEWARSNLPQDYLSRFEELVFVFDMSEKYRAMFTSKIPHIAMHCLLRKQIYTKSALENKDSIKDLLYDPNNNPDIRFRKLIERIKLQSHIVTKIPEEICQKAGIRSNPGDTSQEVADFLNYVGELSECPVKFSPNSIKPSLTGKEAVSRAMSSATVMNLNPGIKEGGVFLIKPEDFWHYSDYFKVIHVNSMPLNEEQQEIYGFERGVFMLGVCKNGERYFIVLDPSHTQVVLDGCKSDSTLMVKWGLYKPDRGVSSLLPGMRTPDVTFYNTVIDLENNLVEYFEMGRKIDICLLQSSEGHPFHTLWAKDDNNVLHVVNSFGDAMINSLLDKYDSSITSVNPQDLFSYPRHLNNILSFGFGLPWSVDWYKTIVHGDVMYSRID